MKYDSDLAKTDEQEPDLRTARMMVQIANTLESSIQFTMDCPSMNTNKRMAVLDLEMWVHREGGQCKVAHSFYKKCSLPLYHT